MNKDFIEKFGHLTKIDVEGRIWCSIRMNNFFNKKSKKISESVIDCGVIPVEKLSMAIYYEIQSDKKKIVYGCTQLADFAHNIDNNFDLEILSYHIECVQLKLSSIYEKILQYIHVSFFGFEAENSSDVVKNKEIQKEKFAASIIGKLLAQTASSKPARNFAAHAGSLCDQEYINLHFMLKDIMENKDQDPEAQENREQSLLHCFSTRVMDDTDGFMERLFVMQDLHNQFIKWFKSRCHINV